MTEQHPKVHRPTLQLDLFGRVSMTREGVTMRLTGSQFDQMVEQRQKMLDRLGERARQDCMRIADEIRGRA